jgi:hypothetical protein
MTKHLWLDATSDNEYDEDTPRFHVELTPAFLGAVKTNQATVEALKKENPNATSVEFLSYAVCREARGDEPRDIFDGETEDTEPWYSHRFLILDQDPALRTDEIRTDLDYMIVNGYGFRFTAHRKHQSHGYTSATVPWKTWEEVVLKAVDNAY